MEWQKLVQGGSLVLDHKTHNFSMPAEKTHAKTETLVYLQLFLRSTKWCLVGVADLAEHVHAHVQNIF